MGKQIGMTRFFLFFYLALGLVKSNSLAHTMPSSLSGTLTAMGSDTMNNLMSVWADAFARRYPEVHIQFEGKGSGTAPTALAEGAAQLGTMSRRMRPSEKANIESRCHCEVKEFPVALDAIAIFVNEKNLLPGISLAQLDGLFAKNPGPGQPTLNYWKELNPKFSNNFVQLYGRNGASGTHVFFQEHVLMARDFREEVQEFLGSSALVAAIAMNKNAIGYCGLGYKTKGTRVLPLRKNDRDPQIEFISPTEENIQNGNYPLARKLWIYTLKPLNRPLPTIPKVFLRFVFSNEAQAIARIEKYWTLPAAEILISLKELE